MVIAPRSLVDFQRRFGDEASCRDALREVRWETGYRCPACGSSKTGWLASRGLLQCHVCGRQISDTLLTPLHKSHLPLATWFLATWLVATTPGLSSVALARQLGLGQKTAWRLLDRTRHAMSSALASPLMGVVEVDEAFFGRKEHQSTVEVLAEAHRNGRVRMGVVEGQTKTILTTFIAERVEPGSTIRTDGWKGYNGLESAGFAHERLVHPSGWVEGGERSTPYADEAISAAKRWILSTYNKPPAPERLDDYLAEFCFRREFRWPEHAFVALLRALATPR